MTGKTPLGRTRGLGSAKSGTHHWIMQRITALALVPLTLWFVWNVVALAGADHAAVAAWAGAPVNAVLLVLLIAATFHHLQLGLQVVVEDYVHGEARKIAGLLLLKAAALLLAAAAIFAVLKLAFAA